ncbi:MULTISPECIES: MobF family relaxase [Mycobacterium]|uniref:AAA family ATPase n=1 Tax=Mycobacterium colombiense TaxID=339268 RepID=A0A329LPF0_9MYCO|nr:MULTISPECIES: MobF family relaxase [Mycobacterium]MDM4141917.1 MobF family relaxase [Mycobacterium sp. FLAC0960]RAV09714.1 AAA family ATPase [Mycobacterium colombiense]
MLTISKLKRWSINYYIDTARTAEIASRDAARTGGGLGEYYSEHETRTPTWLLSGDTHTVTGLVGLSDAQRAGGEADAEVVARWLDEGIAPNGGRGRSFGQRGVHGFDLTFCAHKSVSLLRALRADDVVSKAIADAHTSALAEALAYLSVHASYTRIHNPRTGEKDLVRLPGLVAIAYQHETSRSGDPHLHTHVIVPNRQARADGVLVSLDGTSLYHEARAAGVIYQATLRRELHQSLGVEWAPVDPATGMAEVAGVDRETIAAWSRRSTQLRDWAADHLKVVDKPWTAAQLAAAQKATRPTKPEELAWAQLRAQWRADERGLRLDRAAFQTARAARRAAARTPLDRARLLGAAERIDKAAFTRADLVEMLGAQLPVDTERTPRELVESAVDEVAVRLSAPRAAHQREGHERFTLDAILREEAAVLDLADARADRAMLWVKPEDTAYLSPDQQRAVHNIGASPWLIQPLCAPAGAGKTTSMRALRAAARRRFHGNVLVLAPTGKAVDVAVREGAGDHGYTIAKALQLLDINQLEFGPHTLVVVDEAAMAGTGDLHRLLAATTAAGAKTVLIGDQHQLAPVKARGGMFAQLCTDLPWSQRLSAVWRMRDPDERAASLALRDGGPAPLRRAIGWYRTHDRLHCGDAITMAADALAAYQADTAAGKDALLLCDSTEMADALNQRLHHDTVPSDAPALTGARGHALAVGDVILTRRNDASIPLRNTDDPAAEHSVVRNGQRWQVARINPDDGRLVARRLGDNTVGAFPKDYVREHITYGYALTVHSAQGVTADNTHAVLSENATRALAYVALTRGRDANTAYLYQRRTEQEYRDASAQAPHVADRRSRHDAATLLRGITANDEHPATAHDVAATTASQFHPARVRAATQRRTEAVSNLARGYRRWRDDTIAFAYAAWTARSHHIQADRSIEGLEL